MPEAREETDPHQTDTIIHTVAGNTTLVKGMAPTDIEPLLVEALASKIPFIYLDGNGIEANSLCISPSHVIALIRHDNWR